jgi:Pyridoxamine 5'-phosphate oxidase
MSWAALAAGAPEIAAVGRRALYRDAIGQGLLATVRGSAAPRLHPVWVAIVDGRLLSFINPSAKLGDLESDGRYALHAHVDPTRPDEFSVRGRVRPIVGEDREAIASSWYFEPGEAYRLFELEIESALVGARPDADAWPPRYTSWKAGSPSR